MQFEGVGGVPCSKMADRHTDGRTELKEYEVAEQRVSAT